MSRHGGGNLERVRGIGTKARDGRGGVFDGRETGGGRSAFRPFVVALCRERTPQDAPTGPHPAERLAAVLLAKRRSNDGQTLTKRWPNAGQTLAKRRPNAGQTPVERWPNAGQTPAKRRSNAGQTPVKPVAPSI